ncbi:MAG TPA: hypothetical protein VNN80_28445, partial [Polyangiaceae bacterium]|nr:hypothetical protein [Polyangiaceae bacterium]
MGYRPSTLRPAHGSWFRFVAQEGQLHENAAHTLERLGAWLDGLEAGTTHKGLDLIVLEALTQTSGFTSSV